MLLSHEHAPSDIYHLCCIERIVSKLLSIAVIKIGAHGSLAKSCDMRLTKSGAVQVAHLDHCSLANSRAKPYDCIFNSAFFQVGAMADDDVIDFAAHNLGRRQESGRGINRCLRVIELKLRRLQWRENFSVGCCVNHVMI